MNNLYAIKSNVYSPVPDRGGDNNLTLKHDWQKQTDHLRDHTQIFTDCSKSGKGAGCAVVVPSMSVSCSFKLPGSLSILSIEMIAIYKALEFIKSHGYARSCVIRSDSASASKYLINEYGHEHYIRSVAVTVFRSRTGHAITRSVLHKWGRVS